MTDRPNIVLAVFDAARRDRFGCYGYHRGTTPVADTLAREALVFERMITPAPWTAPSHGSLFTGLYPREHGAHYPVPVLRSSVATLASHLQANGYTTTCVTNNPVIHNATRLSRGFESVIDRPYLNENRWMSRAKFVLGGRDSGAGASNRVIVGLLPRLPRPFFLFVNYMECHWKYTPPIRFERRFVRGFSWVSSTLRRLGNRDPRLLSPVEALALADAGTLRLYSDLYDAELACVDNRFGQVLDTLQKRKLLDDTIIVLASDHGENIGEEGLAGHFGSLRQNLIHVPFVARIPGRGAARISGLAQFTDVFAGLCQLVGLEPPPSLQERPMAVDPFRLGPADGGRPYAFAEWRHWSAHRVAELQRRAPHFDFQRIPLGIEAVQDSRFKLVVDTGAGVERLYDLEVDPHEQADVSRHRPEEVGRLRDALLRWHALHTSAADVAYTAEEQLAVESRLRQLGYI